MNFNPMQDSRPTTALLRILDEQNGPGINFGLANGTDVYVAREDLLDAAARIGNTLRENGLGRGSRIIIALPTSPEYVQTMLGAWMIGAGICTVAWGEIADQSALRRAIDKDIACIAPHAVVTNSVIGEAVVNSGAQYPILIHAYRASCNPRGDIELDHHADYVSHYQLTSGTTSGSRAAIIQHRALIHNIDSIRGRCGNNRSADRLMSWLPLNHDMGFTGGLVWCIVHGNEFWLDCTTRFTSRPMSWLTRLSKVGATLSPNPSFAYQLLSGILAKRKPAELDLSNLRYAWMGAEPVFLNVIQAFIREYGASGLSETAIRPAYGMAEATLAVTMPYPDAPLRVIWADQRALREHNIIDQVSQDKTQSVSLVGCGSKIEGMDLEVRGDHGQPLPEGNIGEIHVRGPSLMRGYFGRAEQPIRDGWLSTGDLGCLVDQELYVTGRIKDLIIRGGVNVHPHEIESAAENVDGVRAGRVAAFSVIDHQSAKEEIVCVAEAGPAADRAQLQTSIREAAAKHARVMLDHVEIVPKGSIPKTTSGKTQRSRCRDMYLSQSFLPKQNIIK